MRYEHIVRSFNDELWAIMPGKLDAIAEFLRLKAAGEDVSAEEIEATMGAVRRGVARQAGAVAVLPLYGTMGPRMNMLMNSSGGTSTEQFGRDFQAMIENPGVKAIVFDVHSPGGAHMGTPELATQVFNARGKKPIIAVANHMMASAAYWVAAAADEIVVTPSSETGSVGVWMQHVDTSVAEESAGIKTTVFSAGKFKTMGHSSLPLTDEMRDRIQGRIDNAYSQFVTALAKYRGVSVAKVKSDFGQGDVMNAQEAVKSGMADRIGTLDETLARLGATTASRAGMDAEAEPVEINASTAGVDVPDAEPSQETEGTTEDLALRREWFRRRVGAG